MVLCWFLETIWIWTQVFYSSLHEALSNESMPRKAGGISACCWYMACILQSCLTCNMQMQRLTVFTDYFPKCSLAQVVLHIIESCQVLMQNYLRDWWSLLPIMCRDISGYYKSFEGIMDCMEIFEFLENAVFLQIGERGWWGEPHRCSWVIVPFEDALFILDHSSATCYHFNQEKQMNEIKMIVYCSRWYIW